MEWTREKTLALINEYRKRRGLWDMTHDDYRKKEMKAKLLLEVSESLGGGIAIVEIEKKFHTLRTQYHRELNRIKRKEPYNSKWFGFKNLQFLSSPKACRANKGRVKEITEDGTLTTKYVIRDATHDTSGNSSVNSNQEEFISIQRKGNVALSYEIGSNNLSTATSRSHELEKLIEETTKDVELDANENKPKNHENNYNNNNNMHNSATIETTGECNEVDGLHVVDTKLNEAEHVESINMQAATTNNENELTFQTNNAHHYIKIQRRDSEQQDEYYEEQEQSTPHIHTIVSGNGKRIYYDAIPTQQHATATTTTAIISNPTNATLLHANGTQGAKVHHQTIIKPLSTRTTPQHQSPQQQQQQQQAKSDTQQAPRDEFATYGEYVSNEMRNIKNREILIALKHKINTALFEASMAELKQ